MLSSKFGFWNLCVRVSLANCFFSGTNGFIRDGILKSVCHTWRSIGHSFWVSVSYLYIMARLGGVTNLRIVFKGFPATFITFFLSFLRSGAVFALIYPCVSI